MPRKYWEPQQKKRTATNRQRPQPNYFFSNQINRSGSFLLVEATTTTSKKDHDNNSRHELDSHLPRQQLSHKQNRGMCKYRKGIDQVHHRYTRKFIRNTTIVLSQAKMGTFSKSAKRAAFLHCACILQCTKAPFDSEHAHERCRL